MINLKEEQRIENIKLANIFAQHLKYTLIQLILNVLIRSQESESPYITITLYLTIMIFAFNFIAAAFLVYQQKEFPKLEYYLIYAVNIFVFMILMVYSLNYCVNLKEDDPALYLYIKAYMLMLLQKVYFVFIFYPIQEIEILIIKVFPLEFMNRIVYSFTSFIIVALILSHRDKFECQHSYSILLLMLLLSNLLATIINVMFTLVLFNQGKQQKEVRNFANLLLTVLFLFHIALYIYTIVKTNNMIEQQCQCLRFIFAINSYISPINLICFISVIFQEFYFFKENLKYEQELQENNSKKKMFSINIQISQKFKQNNKQSIRSLSSLVNPMEASSKHQQTPNFKSEKTDLKLQKMGTSQFGESQNNLQMINSWENAQNSKAFVIQLKEQIENIEIKRKGNKSIEDSFIKQEESQIRESFSQINNPMESGSIITIH